MRLHPHNVSTDTWAAVRALVLAVVVAYEPSNDKLATRLTASAARFVLWAVTTLKAPLNARDLFNRNTIRKFVQKHYAEGHSQTTIESQLNNLALAASGKHYGRPRRAGNPGVGQYTARELANIGAWSRSRPEGRRHDTMGLVSLVAGAGLRTSEAVMVRPRDITTQNDITMVDIAHGSRPRRLAIKTGWAAFAVEVLRDRKDHDYLILPMARSVRSREGLARTLCTGTGESPSLAKLRDTWVISMLDQLPLNVLVQAAGYTSMFSLTTRYQQFVDVAEDHLSATYLNVMAEVQR
ncbi:hypothetical protein HQQ79_02935 [Curtobacterium sp. VKM Ac-2852]|nr:hypothetical protein [Curtobacterium sp. VKM Ac-2852]